VSIKSLPIILGEEGLTEAYQFELRTLHLAFEGFLRGCREIMEKTGDYSELSLISNRMGKRGLWGQQHPYGLFTAEKTAVEDALHLAVRYIHLIG
jgi:putative IMPACT (imprinted ancient) family translation regulator